MFIDIFKVVDQMRGKVFDLYEVILIEWLDCCVTGIDDYLELVGCDIVVLIVGLFCRFGMSCDDLIKVNADIVVTVVREVRVRVPNCILIVMINPFDVMVYVVWKVSGFFFERIFG